MSSASSPGNGQSLVHNSKVSSGSLVSETARQIYGTKFHFIESLGSEPKKFRALLTVSTNTGR